MKNTLIATLLALAAGAASAGYADANMARAYCDGVGEVAESAFHFKEMDETRQQVIDRFENIGYFKNADAPLYRYAVDFAFTMSGNRADAHMGAWSKCMDAVTAEAEPAPKKKVIRK